MRKRIITDKELYSEIEYLIIMWSNDGTKTAGFLTRQIMELIETTKMNKEQQELLEEAYGNWCKQFEVDPNNFDVDELVRGHGDQCWGYTILDHVKPTSKEYKRGQINAYLEGKADQPFFYLTKEEFINKCKTDQEFSEKWGLKIEERELSWEERRELVSEDIARGRVLDRNGLNQGDFGDISPFTEKIIHYWMNQFNIPTKLITITYSNDWARKTIESYENNS